MDQHGQVEVAGREGAGDVPQVGADPVALGHRGAVRDFEADRAPVGREQEVMDGRLVADAGHLVVAMVDAGTTVLGGGSHRTARVVVRGGGAGRRGEDEDTAKDALHRGRNSMFHDREGTPSNMFGGQAKHCARRPAGRIILGGSGVGALRRLRAHR